MRESSGLAQDFHQRPFPIDQQFPPTDQLQPTDRFPPTVWIHRVTKPAFVLGSTQDESILRADQARAAGYEISNRRSGGGLVLVSPMTSCWIDILLPVDHPYWENDISLAFHWVGELWAEALRELGVHGCQVHQGPLLNREHGRVLCFAGLGPGELTLEGRKIVGLSQRRVRAGARFQGLLVSSWDSAPLKQFLQPAALQNNLNLEQVQVGHALLTPDIIDAMPDTFVSLIKNRAS